MRMLYIYQGGSASQVQPGRCGGAPSESNRHAVETSILVATIAPRTGLQDRRPTGRASRRPLRPPTAFAKSFANSS
jgi:hypothetical protein